MSQCISWFLWVKHEFILLVCYKNKSLPLGLRWACISFHYWVQWSKYVQVDETPKYEADGPPAPPTQKMAPKLVCPKWNKTGTCFPTKTFTADILLIQTCSNLLRKTHNRLLCITCANAPSQKKLNLNAFTCANFSGLNMASIWHRN